MLKMLVELDKFNSRSIQFLVKQTPSVLGRKEFMYHPVIKVQMFKHLRPSADCPAVVLLLSYTHLLLFLQKLASQKNPTFFPFFFFTFNLLQITSFLTYNATSEHYSCWLICYFTTVLLWEVLSHALASNFSL